MEMMEMITSRFMRYRSAWKAKARHEPPLFVEFEEGKCKVDEMMGDLKPSNFEVPFVNLGLGGLGGTTKWYCKMAARRT